MPFVLMQYTISHGAGLITRQELWNDTMNIWVSIYYFILEGIMILFALLHIFLTILFIVKAITWLKTKEFKNLFADPLKNTALLTPFISILMTMNVFIGPFRYFTPALSDNFQSLFLPAMIFWTILFIFILWLEIELLGIAFKKGFDISKITFGWLLHPFLLGMLTVVGTGLAAMAENHMIAETAAFLSLISGSMGLFLLLVKMIMVFKSHFALPGLPEKNFLPSFLIVIPNITLFAISGFRFGHFLEHHHGLELGAYSYLVIGFSFAFEIWYLLFGISLLREYFRKNHFKEFYITQWGLICPLVAFVVLWGFVYKIVFASPILYIIFVLVMIITIAFYIELGIKHIRCAKGKAKKLECDV